MIQFSDKARKGEMLFDPGTVVRAKVSMSKAYEPLDGQPDYIGLDRDAVTAKVHFQFDCTDGKNQSTIYAAWAVPLSEQPNPDACDIKRVDRGERKLFALMCACFKCMPQTPEADALNIRSWRELEGKQVNLELGVFTSDDGRKFQLIEKIMPPAPRQQPVPTQAMPQVQYVQRPVQRNGGWLAVSTPSQPALGSTPDAATDNDDDILF